MPIKQSNRLTVVYNIDDKTVSYKQGVNTVYLNSHLYNEFVVRPQSKLRATQTLWITFATSSNVSTATNKTQPTLLAYREVTEQNSMYELAEDTQVQTECDTDETFEYYMQIPDVVLKVPGTWYFSLEVREISDLTNTSVYSAIATSRVGSFVVNNSLSGQGNSTPTDLDIVTLYLTATGAADTAKEYAEIAQQAAKCAPYIGDNNHWFVFDNTTKRFVDTGITAKGEDGNGVIGAQTQSDMLEDVDNYTVTPVCLVLDNYELTNLFRVYAKNGAKGAEYLVCHEVQTFSPYSLSFVVELYTFNRTPQVGDVFLAFFEYEGSKWIVMSRVTSFVEGSVRASILSQLEVTGSKGEKGDKGDNYYTFSIKDGNLIVKTTAENSSDVSHGIDDYGNMILTLK